MFLTTLTLRGHYGSLRASDRFWLGISGSLKITVFLKKIMFFAKKISFDELFSMCE